MQLHIENMVCGACVSGVTKAIQSVDATAEVSADLEKRTVIVTSTAPTDAVLPALSNAGFNAEPI
ncbi:MAG: heavy-metal-associated domain-containing protein [Pseudomonadota bacterium]